MTYRYKCDKCDRELEKQRPIAARNDPCFCAWCKFQMRRMPAIPHLITDRVADREFNSGLSRQDELNEMREADKRYEAQFEGENTVLQEIETLDQAREAEEREAFEVARA